MHVNGESAPPCLSTARSRLLIAPAMISSAPRHAQLFSAVDEEVNGVYSGGRAPGGQSQRSGAASRQQAKGTEAEIELNSSAIRALGVTQTFFGKTRFNANKFARLACQQDSTA